MSLYRFFYNNVVTSLPNYLIESMGGYIFELISHFSRKNTLEIPFRLGGIKISNPVGMPAGWADTPNKIDSIYRLGAGIVTAKTITLNPRKGNPYPRLIRGDKALINSMGLPNMGLKWWSKYYQPTELGPSIISVKGNTFKEWTILIDKLEDKADLLELNFSCPNVDHGIMDIQSGYREVKQITSITSKDILLKLSPEFSPEQNLKFVEKIREDIFGITAVNTYPVFNKRLGNPTKRGGLSGNPIFTTLKAQLSVFRENYTSFADLPILATGGIINGYNAWEILSEFKSLPLSLTGFLINGPQHYLNQVKYLKYKFDYHNIKNMDQLMN